MIQVSCTSLDNSRYSHIVLLYEIICTIYHIVLLYKISLNCITHFHNLNYLTSMALCEHWRDVSSDTKHLRISLCDDRIPLDNVPTVYVVEL